MFSIGTLSDLCFLSKISSLLRENTIPPSCSLNRVRQSPKKSDPMSLVGLQEHRC